jgi:O-antigen/teichoic acid export membrane protein
MNTACSPIQRLLRNSAFTLVVQVLQVTANLVVFLILARCLGKVLLGEYYMVFALTMVFQLLLEGGVGTVLTRRIAQAPETWRAIAAEAGGIFVVIVGVSIAFFLTLGGIWAWVKGDAGMIVRFAAAGIACGGLQIQRYCEGVFHAFEEFERANLARAFQGILFVTLVLALAGFYGATLEGAVLVFAGSQVAAALWLLISLHRRWHCLAWRVSWTRLKAWLKESVPLGIGDMVRGPNWHLDTILLGLLQPAAAVGIYVVAFRPNAPLLCLPRAVLTAIFPSFARMAAGHRQALSQAFANCTRLLWVVALPIVIPICICAEPLIALLVGREYLDAAVLMRILIWKTALSFLTVQFRFLFAAVSQQRIYARVVLGVLVFEALVELSMICWLGSLGACIGCLAGETALTVTGLVICHHLGLQGIDWLALASASAAGAAMAVTLWLTSGLTGPVLVVAVVLAVILYFDCCLLLGALRWEEVRHCTDALRRFVRLGTGRSIWQPEKIGA